MIFDAPVLETALLASAALNAVTLRWCNSARRHLQEFAICPTYRIYTRQGLDLRWQHLRRQRHSLTVVFLDIDGMKQVNEQHGYPETDRRIRTAFALTRHSERLQPQAGRWYSGDEIVLVVPTTEARAAAERLQTALHANGLSATFGLAPCNSAILERNVEPAAELVRQAKAANRRGTINP